AESPSDRTTIRKRALQDRLIELYGQGRRVVVLIDEAHAMPLETLEEIRLLSNLESNRHKLLQIVLFGQPELDEQLALPNMRQLRERITHSFRLEPLVRPDIEKYIDFRMRAAGYRGPNVFTPPALRAIAQVSQGLTRRINILADKALLAAFAEGTHEVTARHARAAIRDAQYKTASRHLKPIAIVVATLLLGIAIGLGVRLLTPADPPVPAAAQPVAPEVPVSSLQPASTDTATADSPVALGPLARARHDATLEWLARTPDDAFTIQLLSAASGQRVESFLAAANKLVDPEQLHVYGVKQGGKQLYAVSYGHYPS